MAVELAEIAAGLPMALSLALAGGITTLREGRRRTALNEAMHELRRPLQALSLSLPADPDRAGALESSLQMAAVALERLDREVNGGEVPGARRSVELEPLLRSATKRWQFQALREGRVIRLRGDVTGARVAGDEASLVQAVDNLISNAIEHGSGEVTVGTRHLGSWVRVFVTDDGPEDDGEKAPRSSRRERFAGRRRHGHGLRIVDRVARAHGGTFRLQCSSMGTQAELELPMPRSEAGG